MTDSRSIHLTTNNSISFLFMADQYSIVYMCHIFFILSCLLFGMACPALELAGHSVELGLSVETGISGRALAS